MGGSPTPRATLPPGAEVPGIPGAGQGRWRGRELGELKARVHADGVAQLFPEGALLAVVGQLEQVEAGGGGGQAATRLPLADGEEAPEDTAQGVPRVLQAHTTASVGRHLAREPGGLPEWATQERSWLAPGVERNGRTGENALPPEIAPQWRAPGPKC